MAPVGGAQVGPLAGIQVLPELRTLRPRLTAIAEGCDPLGLQRAFAAAMHAAAHLSLGLLPGRVGLLRDSPPPPNGSVLGASYEGVGGCSANSASAGASYQASRPWARSAGVRYSPITTPARFSRSQRPLRPREAIVYCTASTVHRPQHVHRITAVTGLSGLIRQERGPDIGRELIIRATVPLPAPAQRVARKPRPGDVASRRRARSNRGGSRLLVGLPPSSEAARCPPMTAVMAPPQLAFVTLRYSGPTRTGLAVPSRDVRPAASLGGARQLSKPKYLAYGGLHVAHFDQCKPPESSTQSGFVHGVEV